MLFKRTQLGKTNVILVYLLVALVTSTLVEYYRWTLPGLFGVLYVMLGNSIAMGKLMAGHLHILLNKKESLALSFNKYIMAY